MDDLDRLFGQDSSSTPDTSPPAPAPAEAPTPLSQSASASPVAQPDDLDRLFGSTTSAPTDQAPPAPADTRSSGFFAGAARGFVSGVGGMPADEAGGVQTILQLAQVLEPGSEADKRFDYLHSLRPGDDWQPKVGSYTDIKSVSDALTYAGEGAGNMAGSLAGFFAHRLAGGAIGGLVSGAGAVETGPGEVVAVPLGAAAGAAAAGAMGIFAQSVGQTRDSIMDEPAIQKALADGTLNRNLVNGAAVVAGLGMTAIEYPQMMRMGLGADVTKEGLQQAVKDSFLKAVLKEGGKVSLEEMAQQGIQEAAQYIASGDPALQRRVEDVLNSGLQSFLPGAIAGGAHHLTGGHGAGEEHVDQTVPTTDADKGQANPTAPSGTAAPADHLGAGDGQSTPGGVGTPASPPHTDIDGHDQGFEEETDEDTYDEPQGGIPGKVDSDQAAALATIGATSPVQDQPVGATNAPAIRTAIPEPHIVSPDLAAAFDALGGQTASDGSKQLGVNDIVKQITEATAPQTGAPTGELTPQAQEVPSQVLAQSTAAPPLENDAQVSQEPATPEARPAEQAPAEAVEQPTPAEPPQELTPPAPTEPEALAGSAVEEPPAEPSTAEPGASHIDEGISIDDLLPDEPAKTAIPEAVASKKSLKKKEKAVVEPNPARVAEIDTQLGALRKRMSSDAEKMGSTIYLPEVRQRQMDRLMKEREGLVAAERLANPEAVAHEVEPSATLDRRTQDVQRLIEPEALAAARDEMAGEHDPAIVRSAVDQAFQEHADEMGSRQHASIGDAVRALREPILDRVRQLVNQHADQAAEGKAVEQVSALQKARANVEARLRQGTNQEKERAGKVKGKSAEGILNEDERTWQRRHAAQDNPRSQRITELYSKLARVAGGNQKSSFKQLERKTIREKLDAFRKEDLEQARSELGVKSPEAIAAANKKEIEETKTNIRRTPEEREIARRDAEDAKYAKEHVPHDRMLAATLQAHPEVTERQLRGMNGVAQENAIKTRVFGIVKDLQNRLGLKTLPGRLSLANSKAVNYLIQAKRIMGDQTQLGHDRLYDLVGLTAEMEHSKSPREFYDQIDKAEKDFGFNRQYDENGGENLEDAKDLLDFAHGSDEGLAFNKDWTSVDTRPGENIAAQAEREREAENRRLSGEETEHGVRTIYHSVDVPKEDVSSASSWLDKPHDPAAVNHRWTGGNAFTKYMLRPDSAYDFMRRFLDKRFRQQVGDVPVYMMHEQEMAKLLGKEGQPGRLRGFFVDPSTIRRAGGAKGFIAMSHETPEAQRGFIVRHELAHALTIYAIRNNIDGAATTMQKMLDRLKYTLLLEGNDHVYNDPAHGEYQYGLSNIKEMVAEGLENPAFQEFLASRELPPDLRRAIGDHKLVGRTPQTFWDLFTSHIAKILHMTGFGRNGMTYLEGLIRLNEPSLRSGGYLKQHAREVAHGFRVGDTNYDPGFELKGPMGNWNRPGLEHLQEPQAAENVSHVFGSAQAAGATVSAYNTTMDMLKRPEGLGSRFRRRLLQMQTMANIAQNTERWLGRSAEKNGFHRILDAVRNRGFIAKNMMADGDRIVANMTSLPRHRADALSALMHDATLHNVDPSQGLSGPHNNWIGKGVLNSVYRAAHARLSAEYAKMPAEDKRMFVQAGEHYRATQDEITRQNVRTALIEADAQNALKSRPAGKTMEDQVNWIMNGGIDRIGTVRQSPADVAMHASLGPLAGTFKDLTSLRMTKGFYTPLVRRGEYYVSSKERMVVPKGAVAVGGDQFMFRNKAAFEDWAKTNTDHLARKPQSVWLMKDPTTGKVERVSPEEVRSDAQGNQHTPVQHFLVSPQLEHYERFEKERDAIARSKELGADPAFHSVSNAGLAKDFMQGPEYDILPTTARKLVEDATKYIQDPDTKNMVIRNLSASIMRQNAGTRITQRQRRRRGIHGYSEDAAHAMADYNVSSSNHIAKQAARPEVNAGKRMIEEELRQRSARDYSQDGSYMRLQEAYRAVQDQLKANETFNPASPGSKWVQTGLTLSFLNHLASPANWVVNSLQPGTVTLPYLAARHGAWRTTQALGKAYRVIGSGQQIKIGGQNILRPIRPKEAMRPMIDRLRKNGMEQEAQVLEALRSQNLISHDAGMELEANEIRKSAAQKGLSRAATVASAMPTVMENINRATTGLSAYWLAKQDGKTHLQSIDAAKDAVNDTQGDYAQSVAPLMFKNPMARLVLQFKKYPQMMMRLLLKSAQDSFKGATQQERVQARKQLIGLTLSHAAVAGLAGAPFTEGLKALAMLSHGIGGGDNWDDWENWVQGWFSSFIGKGPSELLMHGLPRAAGIDLAGRMGLDSLLFFGSPQDNQQGQFDAAHVKSWAFDMLSGAPIGLLSSALSALSNVATGEFTKGGQQLPIPKALDDLWKAGSGYAGARNNAYGIQDPGTQLNFREAVWKALGFQPARLAERYEFGGDKYNKQQTRNAMLERQRMMSGWLAAQPGADRNAQWNSIQNWNKGKDAHSRITLEALYKANAKRETNARKDAKLAAQ